jgi:RND family efflux transporter MFP subunit
MMNNSADSLDDVRAATLTAAHGGATLRRPIRSEAKWTGPELRTGNGPRAPESPVLAKAGVGEGALRFLYTVLLLLAVAAPAFASVAGQIGPYKVELTTEPATIPIGKVRLTIRVVEAAGKPVQGAQVRSMVMMPNMPMGEKETAAVAVPGKPGVYSTDAAFMMAGGYDATLSISGPQGVASGPIPLQTGMNTTGDGGSPLLRLAPWIFAGMLVVFILVRMRQTGQRPNWRAFANRGVIGGVLLLVVMYAGSVYAVSHWRRQGAITPIEAQAMEMNTPAPAGSAAVTLAEVKRAPIESTVRYSGQVVGFNEQDVIARTQGWLTWMPFYNGQKVKAGQVVGRLDTSQIQPQIAQQQAGVNMAEQGVAVARKEYEQARAEVHLAHGEQGMKDAAIKEARANLDAARQDRMAADAAVVAEQNKVDDARAQLQSAKADQQYWQQEIAREKALLGKGAVTVDEYQREQSQAAAADAKVGQAQAGIAQAQADVSAAQASVRKADAMVAAAGNRIQGATAELTSHQAHVHSAEAAQAAAQQKIQQAQTGVQQAEAGLSGVATTRGYSEIRAMIDGVVTQRVVSPGQLVNPGQAILRIAQVSPIRLQANVAESDLGLIRAGSRVVVRTQVAGDKPVVAQVTSITPSVDPVARTGVVEAIVPNRDGRFMPGQFVTMDISTSRSQEALTVPAIAVRTRTPAGAGVVAGGTASYVWVAEPQSGGDYTVRMAEVETGVSNGANVEIVSGLKQGQKVVVTGGDTLKIGDTVTTGESATAPQLGGANEATVEVSSKGFTPNSVSLKAGVPAKLIFIRKDTKNCATEVVLPDYGIKRTLPLNQPVVIEFTPKPGEITFACGMNMLSGKVIAR